MSSTAKPWTPEEEKKMMDLFALGHASDSVAFILGRTIDSCLSKRRDLKAKAKNQSFPISETIDYDRPWTDGDLQMLYELRRKATPYVIISGELRRSAEMCKAKYNSTKWENTPYLTKKNIALDAIEEKKKIALLEKKVQFIDSKYETHKIAADIIADKIAEAIKALPTVSFPIYEQKPNNKIYNDEDMVLILSDLHIGSVHTLEETGGLSEFNEQVLERRLNNLQYGIRDIYKIHSQLYKLPVLHIACLGDIVAGMNAVGEWSNTFISTSIIDQTLRGVDLISKMINYWLGMFEEINFYGIRGNHGRSAAKGVEKDYANWDYIAYTILKERFSNSSRIKFTVPKAWWIMKEIRDHKFLMVHGDDIKGGTLPVKSLSDFEKKMAGILKEIPDYTLAGHFHNSCEVATSNGRVIINGSVLGSDVYSLKEIKAYSRPEQTVFGVNNKHGMTWKYNIDLEHTRVPD